MKPLSAIHLTSSVSRLAGGLSESLRYLSQETLKAGIEVSVVGLRDRYADEDAARWLPVPVQLFSVLGSAAFAYSPKLLPWLVYSNVDVVHLHGLWSYPSAAVLRWFVLTGKPYIVSSHGMLEPWALRQSRIIKAGANWLFQTSCLSHATCLRATAVSEMESLRRLGFKNPIALIPNGVMVPEVIYPNAEAGIHKSKRRALFMSRIHPKKGLLDLVRAWHRVNPENWELVLMGPDENEHLAEVLKLVNQYGLQTQIRYGGEVWDEAGKWRCYRDADLFVLPSYSENFGLVIAEALGCGVPVITTRATPWHELETQRCGWWIDTGEEPLVRGLQLALTVARDELRAMGQRGRSLVLKKYSWEPFGKRMAETYEWMLGRADRPDCISVR